MSGTLVLVRHGQSEWNLKNLFTGWKDPDLTPLGIEEAKTGGKALKDYGIKFDIAFTGVSVDVLLEAAGPQPDAAVVLAHASTGYTTNLPLSDVTGGKAWIVWEVDGRPLPRDHGGRGWAGLQVAGPGLDELGRRGRRRSGRGTRGDRRLGYGRRRLTEHQAARDRRRRHCGGDGRERQPTGPGPSGLRGRP